MKDAQQHEGDQRDIDLDAHGIFAAAEKAPDLEVLLEPFEQQLDILVLSARPEIIESTFDRVKCGLTT
jgi:hypothetical protein